MRLFCNPHGLEPATLLCPCDFPGKNLECIAILFSRESTWCRDWTHISSTAGRFFTVGATWETLTKTGSIYSTYTLLKLHPRTQLTSQLSCAFPSFLACFHSSPFPPCHALFPLSTGTLPTLEHPANTPLPATETFLSFSTECVHQVLGSECWIAISLFLWYNKSQAHILSTQ